MKRDIKSYVWGFVLSIALTLATFLMVMNHWLVGSNLTFVIIGLALIQLWVQLIFFLHLDQENGPRWNLAIFLSTVGIVLVLVVGSLWIMNNLDYRHMSPQQTDQQIIHGEGIHR